MFLNKYFLKNYWCIFWKSEELWTYSKKYIARFIKTSCKHPSSVRWFSINDNATSISGDGTFLRFWVQITTFISRSCVSYHKVYLRISRTANLWKKTSQIKYSTKKKKKNSTIWCKISPNGSKSLPQWLTLFHCKGKCHFVLWLPVHLTFIISWIYISMINFRLPQPWV